MPALDSGLPGDDGFVPLTAEWIDQPVAQIFRRIAEAYGDRVAIDDGAATLSYGQLVSAVAALAVRLESSVSPAAPVLICLGNDRHYPVAMLAALAAGRPYVPLDMSFPVARNAAIAAHSGARTIVTDEANLAVAERLAPGAAALLIRDHTAQGVQAPAQWIVGTASSIAYVIYTSGSTGAPKGVFQNQSNLLHDILQYVNSVHLNFGDSLTLLYSPSVGGANRDIFGALLTGARLNIWDLRKRGLSGLAEFVKDRRISIFHSMPPILRAFCRSEADGRIFADVRIVYVAGDRLFRTDVELYRQHFPRSARMYVGIGSTEIATIARQWFIDHDIALTDALVPVGYAVPDRPSVLVDGDGSPVSPGEEGEIVITSRHMALGYWNAPDLTAVHFHPCPDDRLARVFRTGDMGREQSDGLLHFIGRKDRQMKIRGFRVEPAEIEAILRTFGGIVDAAVLGRGGEAALSLVAYVVAELSVGGVPLRLRTWLAERLPAHMQPAEIVQIDAIPRLANFKLDARRLDELDAERQSRASCAEGLPEHAEEEGIVVEAVRTAWDALMPGAWQANLTFEQAGGDSLRAMTTLLSIERCLGHRIAPNLLGMTTRPRELVSAITMAEGKAQPVGDDKPLLVLVPGVLGAGLGILSFVHQMEQVARVHVIDLARGGDEFRGAFDPHVVLSDIVEAVRQGCAQSRVWLIGHSVGAKLAFEAARQLHAAGEPVDLLGFIDGEPGIEPALTPPVVPPRWTWRGRWRGACKFLRQQGEEAPLVVLAASLARSGRLRSLRLLMMGVKLAGRHATYEAMRRRAVRILRAQSIDGIIKGPYPFSAILFATDDPAYFAGKPADLGWSQVCADLRIVPVGGPHGGIWTPPHSDRLIASLRTLAAAFTKQAATT